MSWSTIRRATIEDEERLNRAAVAFAERHDLRVWDADTAEATINNAITPNYDSDEIERMECKRLGRYWLACVRRALREPTADGIARGYVGRDA